MSVTVSPSIDASTVEKFSDTTASTAALTVYDMLKAMSHEIVIGETRLMAKTGGKEDFRRDE